MNKYNNKDFVHALTKKMGGNNIPDCPYCGGKKFSTPEQFATLIIGEDLSGINLGPSIPSGMIICENCGHINFFALGLLGLLPKDGGQTNED